VVALASYAGLGVTIREVLTDDGSGYRSRDFAQTCRVGCTATTGTGPMPAWLASRAFPDQAWTGTTC